MEEKNASTTTESPQQDENNKPFTKFLQHLPPQNTLKVLNNYANTNLSLNQYNNLNSNTYFFPLYFLTLLVILCAMFQ